MNDSTDRDPLERLAASAGLRKLVRLAFLIPELVMGAIFAGLPAYAFAEYWWPAFETYRRGEFTPEQSPAVLFGFLAFGGLFFAIGVFMLGSGLRSLVRLVAGEEKEWRAATDPTPREIAEARGRVLGFPRLSRRLAHAAEAVKNGDGLRRILAPLATADGSHEVRSRPLHLTLGLTLLGFAAFWNGVILLAASDLVRWGIVGMIFGLFLVPFVLVGLGLAGGAAYFLAALLHPELTVRIKADAERRSLSGAWSFSRTPSRLRAMRISLSVTEKLIEGEGEGATTRSVPVLEQTLVEGASLRASDGGEFHFRWPEGLELPRQEPERRVEWVVRFRATSVGTPDFRFWVPVVVADSSGAPG
jgi:hypothetical protein